MPPLLMTPSSWSLDMVPPMWTKTASSWKRAARASTLRSDIQRHFSLERLSTSCSSFVLLAAGGAASFGAVACASDATDECGLTIKKHSPRMGAFMQAPLLSLFQDMTFNQAQRLSVQLLLRQVPRQE